MGKSGPMESAGTLKSSFLAKKKKKGLEKLSTCAIDPGTQILLMGNEEGRVIPKGMMWSWCFQSPFLPPPTHFFWSQIPSGLFPPAAMHLVPLSQS